MRIGIDARYAFRAERRGIGEYVAQLLTHLAADDDMEVFAYVDGGACLDALALPPGQFHIRTLGVSNPMLFEEVHLPRAAAADRLDLLHLTSNYGPTIAPCPTVYTIQDLIEFMRGEIGPWRIDWRHSLGRAVRQRTLPLQARRAQMIITPSRATLRDVVRLLNVPEGRIRVIPYGAPEIEPADDVLALRVQLRSRGYPIPDQYVLTLAALDPRKNYEVVIDAFRDQVRSFPKAELWLVGIEEPALLAKYHEPWIRAYGYLPRQDLLDLLRASNAFVFPSKYEGFGFPALEAMTAGVPLLASGSSSIPEITGDCAYLFQPNDANALAYGLRQVFVGQDDVERRRTQALQRAKTFTWKTTAREHREVYRQVCMQ